MKITKCLVKLGAVSGIALGDSVGNVIAVGSPATLDALFALLNVLQVPIEGGAPGDTEPLAQNQNIHLATLVTADNFTPIVGSEIFVDGNAFTSHAT